MQIRDFLNGFFFLPVPHIGNTTELYLRRIMQPWRRYAVTECFYFSFFLFIHSHSYIRAGVGSGSLVVYSGGLMSDFVQFYL